MKPAAAGWRAEKMLQMPSFRKTDRVAIVSLRTLEALDEILHDVARTLLVVAMALFVLRTLWVL